MAIIPSGLYWSCKEEYLNDEIGQFAVISGRRYYKVNAAPAICGVHYNSSNYTMPFLLSTDPDAISLRADSGGPWTHHIEFEYLGMTWYYNWGEHGFYNAVPTTDYPILDTRQIGAYNSEAVALYILEQAGAMLSAPFYTIEFNPGNGYGVMPAQYAYCGEPTALRDCTFTKMNHEIAGWATAPNTQVVSYTDGEEVTDLAAEDETVTLYAVWRKTLAWLIRDGNGVYYTIRIDGSRQIREQITVASLTAQVFKEQGFQVKPESALLIDLPSPVLLKWNVNENPELSAEVEAVPLIPQLVVFETMTLQSSVKYVNITADPNSLWNVSFNDGVTWWKHTGSAWVQCTATNDGCLKRKLEILTSAQWAQKVNGTLKFRVWLTTDSWVKRIRVDY